MTDEEIIEEMDAAFCSTPDPTEGSRQAFAIARARIREQCAREINNALLDGVPAVEIANAIRNPKVYSSVSVEDDDDDDPERADEILQMWEDRDRE